MKQNQYSKRMKIIHWSMATLILLQLFIGFGMKRFPNIDYVFWKSSHNLLGVSALLLIIIRIIVRLFSTVPQNVKQKSLRLLSHCSAFGLYFGMVWMSFSGYLMASFGGYPIVLFKGIQVYEFVPHNIDVARFLHKTHMLLAFPFAILIGFHIAAALYHKFILKDKVMAGMWRQKKA